MPLSAPAPATDDPVTAHNVDLSNCDRELIQYPGAIQPHGALVVLQEPALTIVQVSANTQAFFGLPPEAVLQQPLAVLLGEAQARRLQERLAQTPVAEKPVHVLSGQGADPARTYQVFAHRLDGLLLLEYEGVQSVAPASLPDLYAALHATIIQLQATTSLQAFFALAVRQIRQLTGFDRVLVYQFAEDGSGTVIAEAVQAELTSYLGLRFPATDIPAPARRLFSLSWLRHLPDSAYTPVPLVPEHNPLTAAPLDLSYSVLRSVSVMYSGYLQNMGVRASMVMTLLKNGRLWGLISCMQHAVPKYVPYEVRLAGELLAHMVSSLMAAKEDAEDYAYRLCLKTTLEALTARMAQAPHFVQGLTQHEPNLLSALRAQGAAVLLGEEVVVLGQTPAPEDLRSLAHWLSSREEPVFATHHLAQHYPPAERLRACASGLLALRLSRTTADCLLWFRPEILAEVHWAGDPRKPVALDTTSGAVRLLPRTSFALWKETVYGTSRPWAECEQQYALDLRRAIQEVIVERAEELARLNQALLESNREMDAFAYIASHDLKEPLRGIAHFASFLAEDEMERLTPVGHAHLEVIRRLTQRMEDLLESLLHYSRVGQVDLALEPVALNDLLTQALDLLRPQLEERGITVHLARPLPVVRCDRVRVADVLLNLLTNAIKYNDKAAGRIDVGYQDTEPPVFYVRDNGIGIAAEFFEQIFQIFRRLHAREAYGGGAGAGLTITRRVVGRHGGRIWVESTPGEGSTFYFTLAPGVPAGAG
ncbi:MAG: ATP-binding protein [Candidatus Tectimicrobiota bacterium]